MHIHATPGNPTGPELGPTPVDVQQAVNSMRVEADEYDSVFATEKESR